MAVSSGGNGRERIIDCTPSAMSMGIRAGMTVATAHAIVPDLKVLDGDAEAEDQALKRLAAWCYQYSSQVCVPDDRPGLLLEAGASRRLFGGPDRLAERLQRELGRVGYHADTGSAPTPESAWLAAGERLHIDSQVRIRRRLGALPLERLHQDSSTVEAMTRMGFQRLGDLLRLPRRDLTRRFGPGLPAYLDRLLGVQSDPLVFYQPPRSFDERLDLPAEIHASQALLFPLKRLLHGLCGTLRGVDSTVQSVTLALQHEDHEDSVLDLRVQSPTQDTERLMAVLRERLARLRLPGPVRAIRISAPRFLEQRSGQASLFRDTPAEREADIEQLAERLQARLGRSAVSGLAGVEDHRPEYSWRRCQPGESTGCTALAHRPAWLLPRPQRCEIGDYFILAGPERIESGWWDGRDCRRDYFIARDNHGSLLWVFHEYKPESGWYLHGIFA